MSTSTADAQLLPSGDLTVTITPNDPQKVMGAYEGASRTSRELAMHRPTMRSADGDLLRDKQLIDARARDNTRNDGYMTGASATHKDSIVGAQYMLNSRPAYKILGLDEKWADEFQEYCEQRFTLYAESNDRWIDASRHDTLTGLVRLGVGVRFMHGEVAASVEWIRETARPYKTALQMVDPDRICNPHGMSDVERLRGGVETDRYGAPLAVHIRNGYANDPWALQAFTWSRIPIRKPWGRIQFIHLYERMRPDQTRGVADMVSVLKQMKMTSRFQDIVLQNAVVNATYAATIESELPREVALGTIGADNNSSVAAAAQYLQALAQYGDASTNLHIDGVKIPHLFPGSKLQLRPAGTTGGVGEDFESSLLRHVAAALGLSYEQFSKDYSQTNYTSARASMNETWKYMQSQKKITADSLATHAFALWLEEDMNRPDTDMPLPANAPSLYDPLMKEAYTACSWIGASRGQVDELKETQAAAMRMGNSISTLEDECIRTGKDWREVLKQKGREKKLAESLGIELTTSAITPGANDALGVMKDAGKKTPSNGKAESDTDE